MRVERVSCLVEQQKECERKRNREREREMIDEHVWLSSGQTGFFFVYFAQCAF
jgi:hypothetical protein